MQDQSIYCPYCDEIRYYKESIETVKELYHEIEVEYKFNVCRCEKCKEEIPATVGYYHQKSDAKIKAYMKMKNIPELDTLLIENNLSVDELADKLGFNPDKVRLYCGGAIPSEENAKILNEKIQLATAYGKFGGN